MRYSLSIFVFALIFPLLSSRSLGEDAVLPGSKLSISEAFQECSDVVVGARTARGGVDIAGSGSLTYFHSKLQVEMVLHGDAHGELICNFRRWGRSKTTAAEREPTIGTRYIVFLKHDFESDYKIIKFVEYSDDQLSAIKKVIRDSDDKHSTHKD